MDGSFACPRCGSTVELSGLTPGREVRCGWCGIRVEVPFLPRVGSGWKRWRWRRRRPLWASWVQGGLGLAVVLALVLGGNRLVQSRCRDAREKAMTELADSSRAAEATGQLGQALVEIEAALALAREGGPTTVGRLGELRRRRDRLSRREAEARLGALAGAEPGRAVGECLTLLARVRDDPTLAGLRDAIVVRLEQARRLRAEADAADARRALAEGRAAEALASCERLARRAVDLAGGDRDRAREEAEALATQVIQRHGVVVEPVRGRFTIGSETFYATLLHRPLEDALRRMGYLPREESSRWRSLWDAQATYRATLEVAESLEGEYFQTRNRLSRIQVDAVLDRPDAPPWRVHLSARTRVPVPNLSAYQASRLASHDGRSPEVERQLFDDARAALAEQFAQKLRSLPPWKLPDSSIP